MKKTLLSLALVMGSFAATSFGGTTSYFSGEEYRLSGSIGAGYSNYYTFSNVVPSADIVDRGVTSIGATLKYEIPSTFDIIASFSNTEMDSNIISDATNLFVGIQGEGIKGLTTTFGYNLADGGLPGFFADERRWTRNNGYKYAGTSGMDHLLRAGLKYQFPDTGLFITGNAAYSVHGTEGWLFDVGIGYEWAPSDRVSIILAGEVSFSQDYMTTIDAYGKGQKLNGTDGYSVSLIIPIKATQSVTVLPYVSAIWAGHNPQAYSSSTQDAWNIDKRLFKNFAVLAGVAAIWNF